MPDTRPGPLLSPDDTVRFIDSHRPGIADGDYTITLRHTVEDHAIAAERSLSFAVKGPRLSIRPADVASRFPAPRMSGPYDTVLPHIILDRATLPWERSPLRDDTDDPPPWVALLLLTEGEAEGLTRVVAADTLLTDTVDEPAPKPRRNDTFAMLSRESTDDGADQVLLLDLPAALARALLPTPDDLRLLSTVRQVDGHPARAIVMANRLPEPGARHVVHLVSLEGQYDASGRHWSSRTRARTVSLVSLARWTFTCEPAAGDLRQILDDIEPRALALDTTGLTAAGAAVAGGAVPLAHHRRDGDTAPVWYHGPLSPAHPDAALDLPARHGRDLLRHDRATGMLDLSYAAAWTLGRMLALRNPSIGAPLAQWKRAVAHAGHAASAAGAHPEHAPSTPVSPVFGMAAWFERALAQLGEVPLSYLLPDPAQVPPETLAPFTLDTDWLAALVDGAFSIGRTSVRQWQADRALRAALPRIKPLSGVLLRSRAVAGWEGVMVDGISDGLSTPLDILRFERIAPDTLFVLFDGVADQTMVHLHPQAIHFGCEHVSGTRYRKNGRNVPLRDTRRRVIDITALSRALSATAPHAFAFAMVDRAPRVLFRS